MSRRILRTVILLLLVWMMAGCSSAGQIDQEQPGAPGDDPAATIAPAVSTNQAFDCAAVTEIPAAECRALVTFYQATGGPDWIDSSGWLATTTPCSWVGVTCVDGHVESLGLYFNDLQGQLPAALVDLGRLRVVDLHNNRIGGPIPAELGLLASLEYLDLSSNQLDGTVPAELGDLPVLQGLYLPSNNLSGSIPAEIGQLASLRSLDLSRNRLSGPMPDALADLAALETIRLSGNMLEGAIPFGLGQLPALTEVDLSFNQLTGSAPSALFEAPIHQLWGNRLDGTIFVGDDGRQDANYLGAAFTFDSTTADSVWPELVAARSAEPGPGMRWTPPEHIVFTLVGEDGPQAHAPMGLYVPAEAQIQVYPTAGLNEEVQPMVAALQQLLADEPDLAVFETTLPELDVAEPGVIMLPPSNAQQMFRAQAEYLSFAGGRGVRYLTQLSQGLVPVNNQDLFYTFQGLTDDESTYVAAYFPVSLPRLPDSPQISEADFADIVADWPGYLEQTAAMLDEQRAAAFTPDLAALDALINSLSVSGTTPPPPIEGEGSWPNDGESVDSQPILQWAAVDGAVGYHLVVLDDVAFPPSVVIDQTVIEPMLTVDSPLAPGHYSWTVRAVAGDDTVLAELNRTFLVKDAINLVAPAVGEQIGPDILLQWQSYPGAVSYQVIVIDDAAYPPKVASDLATTETSLALPAPLKPGSYSWTVWAFDENQQLVAELTGSFVVTDSD